MVKLLIGGSPCTYWSIAQQKNREIKAEGLGWELFKNYLIAKEKFNPDFFLYENNVSASSLIKNQIKIELNVYDGTFFMVDTGVRYIEINSALVSAQNRQRFYIHNCGEVKQPQDRGIILKDIIENDFIDKDKSYCLKCQSGIERDCCKKQHTQIKFEPCILQEGHGFNKGGVKTCKCPTLTTKASSYTKKVFEPCVLPCGQRQTEKSRTITAGYHTATQRDLRKDIETNGFMGKQGVMERVCAFAFPIELNADGEPIKATSGTDGKTYTVYKVSNGLITIKEKQYPIKLPDGFYIIRKLTVTECCRLQTLPDNYCRAVSDSQAYKGLGNGWTAEVIIHILRKALDDIPRNEKLLVLSMYDGIGTGRYCLDKMGFNNVEYHAYEIDKYAIKVAQSNYPDIMYHGDAFNLRNTEKIFL